MRPYIRLLAGAAVATAMAACADSGGAPSGPNARPAPSDRPSLDYNGPLRFWGYRTSTFSLTSAGGTFNIGDGFYVLTVPANAVCSLKSSYGPGTWDTPCATLGENESITVTATYGFSSTGPAVDFSPALRFSPTSQVTLSTMMYAPLLTGARGYFQHNPSALDFFGVFYVPSLGSKIVTDAATDPSMVTHISLTTGLVWRRVKHFSGYSIATGLACDPSPDDPDCVEVPPVVDNP